MASYVAVAKVRWGREGGREGREGGGEGGREGGREVGGWGEKKRRKQSTCIKGGREGGKGREGRGGKGLTGWGREVEKAIHIHITTLPLFCPVLVPE